MRWRSEALANEVVRSIEACHLNELWEINRVHIEVLNALYGAFDVLERDQDIDELFLKLSAAFAELLGHVHLVLVLDEANNEIRDVELGVEFESLDEDGSTDKVTIIDHLSGICLELVLAYL